MSEIKKYTVSEIDALRQVINNKWLYGTYNHNQINSGMSRIYYEEEKNKCVEELVRTSMMAGHTAEDLLASEKP